MLKVKKINFLKLYTNKRFKIPSFQRKYVWRENEWEDLFNDIINISVSKNSHFMGSILLKEQKDYFEIIDGQQRFITIILFIKAFEKIYKISSKNRIEKILLNNLEVNDKDNVFASIINDTFIEDLKTTNNNSQNLKDAFIYFKKRLSEKKIFGKNIKSDFKIYQILIRLIFVEIIIDTNSNPYLIFETLNARGVELNISDLVKNHLIEKSKDKNFINNEWQRLTNGLNETEFEELFQFFSNSNSNKKRLLKEIINDINSDDSVKDFIKKLSIYTQTYKQLSDITIPYSHQGIQEYISYLNYLGTNLFKILAVPAKTQFKYKEYLKLLKLLEVFIFRYIVICKKNEKRFKKELFEIARKINNNKLSTANEVYNLLHREFFIDDEEFENAFSYISLMYSKKEKYKYHNQSKIVRYILYRIENYLRGDKLLSLIAPQTNDVSIEHIVNESNEEISDSFKYRLGNYALMKKSDNNQAGLKKLTFAKKKERFYKNSTYMTIIGKKSMLKPLYEYNVFDEKNIKYRQRELAKIAVNIWKLDGREFKLESSND